MSKTLWDENRQGHIVMNVYSAQVPETSSDYAARFMPEC